MKQPRIQSIYSKKKKKRESGTETVERKNDS